MKQLFFTNWNLFRVIRFCLGVMIIVQAYEVKDWMYGLAGVIFSMMALFNTGCCSVNNCTTTIRQYNTKETVEEVKYEEVK